MYISNQSYACYNKVCSTKLQLIVNSMRPSENSLGVHVYSLQRVSAAHPELDDCTQSVQQRYQGGWLQSIPHALRYVTFWSQVWLHIFVHVPYTNLYLHVHVHIFQNNADHTHPKNMVELLRAFLTIAVNEYALKQSVSLKDINSKLNSINFMADAFGINQLDYTSSNSCRW